MLTEEHIVAVEARCDALELQLAEVRRDLDNATVGLTALLKTVTAVLGGQPLIWPDGTRVRVCLETLDPQEATP